MAIVRVFVLILKACMQFILTQISKCGKLFGKICPLVGLDSLKHFKVFYVLSLSLSLYIYIYNLLNHNSKFQECACKHQVSCSAHQLYFCVILFYTSPQPSPRMTNTMPVLKNVCLKDCVIHISIYSFILDDDFEILVMLSKCI